MLLFFVCLFMFCVAVEVPSNTDSDSNGMHAYAVTIVHMCIQQASVEKASFGKERIPGWASWLIRHDRSTNTTWRTEALPAYAPCALPGWLGSKTEKLVRRANDAVRLRIPLVRCELYVVRTKCSTYRKTESHPIPKQFDLPIWVPIEAIWFTNREVPPDVIFGLYELTLRLWKNGANSAVKCIRRLRLWACTHVEYGWVASGPWVPRCCKFHPPDDVVFVFVFVLPVRPSRNRKSTCKNTAHPHVFVFIVC